MDNLIPQNNNFSAASSNNGVATMGNHSTAVDIARASKEVEAKMLIARKFPRDEGASYNKLMNTCSRSKFAATAIYSYPKGGQKIEGPSIRLLEAAARAWGNIEWGWREINRYEKSSLIEAYAWDLETNSRPKLEFVVEHTIDTKKGPKLLASERDIYEKLANYAARRLRKCLEQVIPEDVREDAKQRCNQALINDIGDIKQKIRSMIEAFKEFGVTPDVIEKRIGNKLNACSSAQIMNLGKIYTSLKDGVSEAADWFDMDVEVKATPAKEKAAPKAKVKPPEDDPKEMEDLKAKVSELAMKAQGLLDDAAFDKAMSRVKTDTVKNAKKGVDILNTIMADAVKVK
jgi:hypothetical protein